MSWLDGIRVLDFSQVWAGPYAARFWGDMGADVIHIEGPDFADAVRGVGRSGGRCLHRRPATTCSAPMTAAVMFWPA